MSLRANKQADTETAQMLSKLKQELYGSSGEQRKAWADEIILNDLDIEVLSKLFDEDARTAMRFQWLLSDVGLASPVKLRSALPFLFNLSRQSNYNFKTSFASWWHYVGVPTENEGEAIDCLFGWLNASDTNSTCKTRSLWVLLKLSYKYPVLKSEISLSLQNLSDMHSKDFRKRVEKILRELEE